MKSVYSKLLIFLKKGQKRFFLFTVLYLLMAMATVFFTCLVPLLTVVLLTVLSAGYKMLSFDAYNRTALKTDRLFCGFGNLRHVSFGSMWALFRALVWLLIPVSGIVIAIVKLYQFRFVPYILLSKPEVKALDAANLSEQQTNGFKKYFFLTDISLLLLLLALEFGLYCLSSVSFLTITSKALMICLGVIMIILITVIRTVFTSAVYTEFTVKNVRLQKRITVCPSCRTKLTPHAHYCSKCGKKTVS